MYDSFRLRSRSALLIYVCMAVSARDAFEVNGSAWCRLQAWGFDAFACGAQGKRIIVFICGGASHSEMRVVHQLSKKLNRDVLLGSTSIDGPADFLTHLHELSSLDGIVKERK